MKFLLILLLSSTLYSDYISIHGKPTFLLDKSTIKNFTKKEKEILNIIYKTGNHYSIEKDMGYWLAAKAFVENSLKLKDNNKNSICGVLQVDTRFDEVSCKALESNPFTSAITALEHLENWRWVKDSKGNKIRERDIMERIRKYNVGYTNDSYQWVHILKVNTAFINLKRYKKYWLD